MSQVGLLEVQKFQNLAVHVRKNKRVFDFSSYLFFRVCGVWKTKCPRVIDFPMGDAHLSLSTPTALGFKCYIRTDGVGNWSNYGSKCWDLQLINVRTAGQGVSRQGVKG